jgi:signal transduction histidine kinase
MTRLYVSTRDPLYRTYFNQILAIRSGKAPRPINYDSSFWTRVLAGESQSVTHGQPESLVAQAHSARFTPAELAALTTAIAASNTLADGERAVMSQVATSIRRGATPSADLQTAYLNLSHRTYVADDAAVTSGLDQLAASVNAASASDVRRVRSYYDRLAGAQFIALVVFVGLAMYVAVAASRRPARSPRHRTTAAPDVPVGETSGLPAVAGAQFDLDARERAIRADRDRLARDLDDVVIPEVRAAASRLNQVQGGLTDPVAGARITTAITHLEQIVAHVRSTIYALRRDSRGDALRAHATALTADAAIRLNCAPRIRFVGPLDMVTDSVGANLLTALHEALSNIVRHSAASRTDVEIEVSGGHVVLTVRDDGIGPGQFAAQLGGTCTIEPIRPTGTAIQWTAPLPTPQAHPRRRPIDVSMPSTN